MGAQRVVRGSENVPVVRKTEIVVRAEVDHLPWLPAAVESSSGSYNSTAQAPSCIQFVKLDGGCSGSSLSPARKLLKLSFAGSTFIEPQTPFHSQPSAQTVFSSKTYNFLIH